MSWRANSRPNPAALSDVLTVGSNYLGLMRRWAWLILLGALLGGALGYVQQQGGSTTYLAKARLLVGPGVDSTNPSLNDLRASAQLMEIYAELATSRSVLQRVVQRLDLKMTADELGKRTSAKTNSETLILTVQTRLDDHDTAVDVVNAVANELVEMSPARSGPEQGQLAPMISNEIKVVERMIAQGEALIQKLEAERQVATDVAQQTEILDQIDAERDRLSDNHRTLSQLYESSQENVTNRVQIIETALTAKEQKSRGRFGILLGATAAAVVALCVAVAIEYITDRVDSAPDLALAAHAPVLGSIVAHRPPQGEGRDSSVVLATPDSAAAEGYRLLGTQLLFAAEGERPRAILVCAASEEAADDTFQVVANLATVLATAGQEVVLIDGDLRRGRLSELFGVAQHRGLGSLVAKGNHGVKPVPSPWLPGLSVVPSGPPVPDPFEILASPRMQALVEAVRLEAPVVLIATAPLDATSDSLMLAVRTDGAILVARRGQTRRAMVGAAVAQLRSLGLDTVATVLTNARGSSVLATIDRAFRRARPADATAPARSRAQGVIGEGRVARTSTNVTAAQID